MPKYFNDYPDHQEVFDEEERYEKKVREKAKAKGHQALQSREGQSRKPENSRATQEGDIR